MDSLFKRLISYNQDDIRYKFDYNQDDIRYKFDYIFLFIHTFIVHEFQNEVIKLLFFNLHIIFFFSKKPEVVIKLAKHNYDTYTIDLRLKKTTKT